MLNRDDAEALSQVGAGTPIGELLRRYWVPVAAVDELGAKPILPVRVLGEDLVLYRDKGGTFGLLARRCPHRQFDLSYGMIEDCGIRCSYHGWRFDERGRCLEQPFEETVNPDSTFKERIRTRAYPVQAKAGLLWAYLGPEPSSLLPDWAGFYSPGFTVVSFLHLPCNWVQVMEGFYDPVHIEWLHDRWSYRLHDREIPARRPKHTAFRWLDFEHGVVFQRKLQGSDRWLADRTVVFPNIDAAGGQGWYLTWIVPVDDVHTIMVYRLTITSWKTPHGQVMIPPKPRVEQERIPSYRKYASLEPQAGPTQDFGSHLVSQDYASWLGPGPILDRTREHLGETRSRHDHVSPEALRASENRRRGRRSARRDSRPAKESQDHASGGAQGIRRARRRAAGIDRTRKTSCSARFFHSRCRSTSNMKSRRRCPLMVKGLRPDWWKR